MNTSSKSLTNTLNQMSINENGNKKQKTCTKECDPKTCDQKLCDQKMCDKKMCDQKTCDQKTCTNPFKVPKSYSEVLKENKYLFTEHTDLLSQHLETLKELELAKKTIRSLRELNTKLIDSKSEYNTALKKAQEETLKEKEEKTKFEEQGKLFLRTYTNMSIEMLKMEEKLAKYEHRVW